MHPEDVHLRRQFLERILATGEKQSNVEYRVKHRDGCWRWHVSNGSPIRNSEGSVTEYLGIARDVTSDKQLQEEIRQRNLELSALNAIGAMVNQSLDLEMVLEASLRKTMSILNAQGGLIYFLNETNGTFSPVSHQGIPPEMLRELSGFRWGEGLSGQVAETGEPMVTDLCDDARNVSSTSVREGFRSYAGVPITSRNKILGVMSLVTFQKNAFRSEHLSLLGQIGNQVGVAIENARLYEQARQDLAKREEAEKKYHDIFENSNDSIFVHDAETGKIVDVNRTACEMFGYTPEEMKRINVGDFSLGEPPYTQKEALQWIHKAAEYGPQRFEWLARNKQGKLMWFENNFLFAEIAGKKRVLVFGRNIDDRKAAEQDRERLLRAIEQAAEVVVITNPDGAIQYVNKAFEHVTGYTAEEVQGQNPKILKSGKQKEGFYRELWQTITRGKTWQGQFVNRRKDGSLYTEEASISPVTDVTGRINNFVAVKRDITSEIELKARLVQAQKMESIGNLAGGIAHDFNNILFPIVGMSELLMEDLPPRSPEWENAEEIFRAGNRGRDLVRHILAFSRQSEHKLIPTRMQNVLKEVLKLSKSFVPSYIGIKQDVQPDCGMVMADPTQIHQVAMNVITNAYHAVEKTGGEISVVLKETVLEDSAALGMNLRPGKYAVLSISDTGHGISSDLIDKIFDPYFTTKEKGRGTGLGLAVVHGILQDHKGDIHVTSEIGKGTTFNIYIPLLERSIERESPKIAEEHQTGTERILLVDDEVSVAKLEKQMLERMGYEVTSHLYSIEALKAFKADPISFDLVITDMSMPNIPGDELARKIKAIRSDVPIIICTGFSERICEADIKEMGINGLLMKPILKSDLANVVRKVLDEAKGYQA